MRITRPLAVGAVGALAVTSLLVAPAAGAAHQSSSPPVEATPAKAHPLTNFAFHHVGFGTAITGNPAVHSGQTARTTMCTRQAFAHRHNETAGVHVGDLLNVDGVETKAHSFQRKNTGVVSVTRIAGASLAGGVIQADGLQARVRTWHNDKTGFHSRVKTTLASLEINGKKIKLTGANQRIKIPAVGTLVINQQRHRAHKHLAWGVTNVLKLQLVDGTKVRVGHAWNRIDGNAPNGTFWGNAWGSRVKAGNVVKSGRTANQPIPCVGSRNHTRENETAGVDLGAVGSADAIRSWVRAAQRPHARAFSNSRIADVSLLGGSIQIKGIEAHVQVRKRNNGSVHTTFHGTKIGKIVVLGIPIDVPTKPNQQINLAGLAVLTFNEQHESRRGGRVVAASIKILGDDGVTVELGHARAGIRR